MERVQRQMKSFLSLGILSIMLTLLIGIGLTITENNTAQSQSQSAIEPAQIIVVPSTFSDDNAKLASLNNDHDLTAVDFMEYPEAVMWQTKQGNENAPVTIVEYGAYGNNNCRITHHRDFVKNMLITYQDQISYYFVSLPLSHPNDRLATESTLCALDQSNSAFWIYHNYLITIHESEFSALKHYQDHIKLAKQLGLDEAKFSRCLYVGQYRELTFALMDTGRSKGFMGQPIFSVNGKVVLADQLESVIQSTLGQP